jgi:hypothetical protein
MPGNEHRHGHDRDNHDWHHDDDRHDDERYHQRRAQVQAPQRASRDASLNSRA